MKSIKIKMVSSMVIALCVLTLIIVSITAYLHYTGTLDTLKNTLTQVAVVAANQIEAELQANINIVYEIGSIARLSSQEVSKADKQKIIDQKIETYGFLQGDIIDLNGKSIFNDLDVSDREYFKEAIKGNTYVSEPLVNKVTGENTIIIAAPLWANGFSNTEIKGVVFFVPDKNFLNDIVKGIAVGKTGSAYINNKQGTTIAHRNEQIVLDRENTMELSKTDKSLEQLSKIERKMSEGGTGFGSYSYRGANKFLAYAPIPGGSGWSFAVSVEQSEYVQSTVNSIIISVVISILLLLISVVVSWKISGSISDPIKACAQRLAILAEGDLSSPVPQIKSKDETGILANATETIVSTLSDIIRDEDYLLSEMAKGNFNISTTAREKYVGDFNSILLSITNINHSLSDTLSQINESSEQVSSGADQVAGGAQALSQGTTEQASSIEELSATIAEISEQIKSNASNSRNASGDANFVEEQIENGDIQMKDLARAMEDLNSSSGEIAKVIKTIEDIAFQTNILALNAAVEAARAGEAGKGFAVVADEVRNLAGKSAEAAKNTTNMIGNSIKAIKRGNSMAESTADALDKITEGAKRINHSILEIANSSNEQAIQIVQVTQGIEQISAVIQTNSATAEESAAASEELSGQAQMLKELVDKFKLKDR